jgi:toxin ParE1/3/4
VKYRLSRETGNNLRDIEDYTTRRWGKDQREKYLREIFAAFTKLAAHPELGHSRPDVPPPFLAYGIGSHLIVYRHNQPKERIEVLAVLHTAMDIEKRITGLLKRKPA